MNEYQTAHFTVGASLVAACFILGLIITELIRKLAKERETVERLRTLAKTLKRLEEQANWSKEDHD